MGYLNNASITVDAILTLKGRELLAKGGDAFNITQFAVGDDEIDYTLWNPKHPLGTSYYGTIIENMPITIVTVGNTAIDLLGPGSSAPIAPSTANLVGGNANLGYTAILSDNTIADLIVTNALQNSVLPTTPSFIGDNQDAQSIAVAGFGFSVIAKTLLLQSKTATITIIGNETGGSVTINLTVQRATAVTVPVAR